MLNTLHLLNSYLGISEVFIWNMLSSYERFKPVVIASRFENLGKYPLPSGTLLSCQPEKKFWQSFFSRIINDYCQVDYDSCMEEISRQPIDIIHAHYGYRGLVSLDLKEKIKAPYVTSFYGYDLGNKKFLSRAAKGYQRLFRDGDAFCVEGPAMREKLFNLGCPWDKIHIMPIGIYPERFRFTGREWDGNRTINFLFIGRLVEKKGLLTALKAFIGLKNEIPWSLTVIGDGPQKRAVEAFIKKHAIQDKVTLLGNLSMDALPQYYDKHDILIQPSQTASDGDSEGGAPTVLLEAQASGMPIVSTWHDDIPNVVKNDKNGFLAREGDADDFGKNILKMISRHNDWPDMASIGLSNIMEHHNIARVIVAMEKKYFYLLS